ncbi:hypothetical protein [Bacillus sp. S14(2024)]|uniref:hypothetical protein n=1 Tax=Bacillus sp. S14(2024) TaxID=3162884 RepID=UPI003D1B8FFF
MINVYDEFVKNFSKKPYNADEIIRFFELSNATEVEVGKAGKYERYYFKEGENQKTIFIKIDKTNVIKDISLSAGKVESLPSDLAALGCLAAILIPIGLIIWFAISLVSSMFDGPNIDTNNDPDNPYIKDFDGDGLDGTEKDHDIYHKYLK